jgi:hypothetical protein
MGSHKKKTAALVLCAAAMVWGCESSDVLAPTGSQIIIEANPTTVTIDLDAGETEGQSLISAQFFDSTGAFPLEGINVTFTTTAGTLESSQNTCGAASTCSISGGACAMDVDCPASAVASLETDGNGVVTDVLVLTQQDASTADVSVRSSTITASVTVTKTVLEGNVPAEAVIVASPSSQQMKGAFVTFDGTGSDDPDGAGVTCYQWTINSVIAASNEVVQNTTASVVTRKYEDEQELTVTLRVSDRSDAATFCTPGTTADTSLFSPDVALITSYDIVCDLTNPVVNAGLDQQVTISSGGSIDLTSVSATDDESAITGFAWECRTNDSSPQSGETATCVYTTTGTFTATLFVDNECGLTGTDTVRVTVTP